MSDKKFWYAKEGEKYGSYTQKELKEKALSGDIDDTCLIWLEGTQNWIPATSVKGLLPPKFSEPPPIPSSHPSELLTSESISLQLDSAVVVNADIYPENPQKTTDNSNLLIPVSPERIEYNKIRLKYQDIAEKAAKDFSENWFRNMDDLHERASSVVGGYLNSAINEAICDLVAKGIQDIDEKSFFENYLEISWDDDFSDIDDKYNEIVLKAEELDAYRTARRQNRGRFVGGGFGLEGAITGMAKAGAANLAVGVLHGTFNLGAKAVTSGINAVKKAQLFDCTKTFLVNAAYKQVFLVHSAYVAAINERMPEKAVLGLVNNEDKLKAERLFENVKKGRITNTEVQKILLEVLTLNPYDDTVYMYWMQTYGDDNNLLERTAEYFGVKAFITDKRNILALLKSEDINESSYSPDLVNKALGYFLKIAEQGNKNAQFHLGMIYADGIGVTQNRTLAVSYYQKSAEQGFPSSQAALGIMYENGWGVIKDDTQAINYYRKAAEQGNAMAQYNLGLRYAKGKGLAKDEVQAKYWYLKAAEQGNELARNALSTAEFINSTSELIHATSEELIHQTSELINKINNQVTAENTDKFIFYGKKIIYFCLMFLGVFFIFGGVIGIGLLTEKVNIDNIRTIVFTFSFGFLAIILAKKIKPDVTK